ncbi:FAD-dependent oxidoreductase [Micromonospora sp. KC213]|uniref:FAD-dependent oxidoreductase n=1 Tax=Micromonospora sp. KC213 TaxID=2530378 RepID=UPI001044232E|nr:FAD-dependent oxidoreductase [Micromonospora sp. KC213]TDC39693.1 FAD-dependent oxidoreductase [Micromonospora sp. KC213]
MTEQAATSRLGTVSEATVVVAGGGPAGMMLGLMLARAGIDVVVLEKHSDFLRDFRGDTIHPSTLELIEELQLTEKFAKIPYNPVRTTPAGSLEELNIKYPYVAMAPQWDFLDMLADEGRCYPHFHLLMDTEVTDTIREQRRIAGVRYRDRHGQERELRAALTVAADGRHSTLRAASGLPAREYGVPVDVLWFRLSKSESDPQQGIALARVSPGRWIVGIDRRTYWQVAYFVRKGGYAAVQAAGIEAFRQSIRDTAPELVEQAGELKSFDNVSVLDVRVNRAPRWHLPGLLLIGDAAHAMSPLGGVGINLAIQDAVATANILYPALLRAQRTGTPVPEKLLHDVQRRRELPTRVIQSLQRAAQQRLIDPVLRGAEFKVPPLVGVLRRIPQLRRRALRTFALGIRQEHVRTPRVETATEPVLGGQGAPRRNPA